MGHHLDAQGRFQSDKFPWLKPDSVLISFRDKRAWGALTALADGYDLHDPEFAADVRARLEAVMSAEAQSL